MAALQHRAERERVKIDQRKNENEKTAASEEHKEYTKKKLL